MPFPEAMESWTSNLAHSLRRCYTKVTPNISAATFAEGLYYALHVDNEGNPTGIYSYDLKTGSSEKYMDLMASSVICDMTYDYASQSILFLGDAWPNTTLLRLDLATKEITTLHDFTDTSMMCIAADYDGEIYLLDRQGILYRMDKTTYELTSVIDTDQYINGLQSMDFDHNTGKLYWVSTNYGICYNYEIDVDNETMNSIGSVSNTQLVGLFTVTPKPVQTLRLLQRSLLQLREPTEPTLATLLGLFQPRLSTVRLLPTPSRQ